jgi:predicted  nucleic acid-binding Zn-ribbon protein
MNTGFQLFQLQEIDSAIDKANIRIKEIEIDLKNENPVKQANELVEKREFDFLSHKSLFNSIDNDIQSKKIKKAQSESSLYGGTISNSKELQDLQKEIASLSVYIAKSEDELMNKYVELENAEKELSEAKENLDLKISESESRKALLNGEKNKLINLIQSLLEKRESVITPIESSTLGNYDLLRKTKNGIAVARLQDDSCSSCGALLTANQCQQARSQVKLFYCPSCGRIMYG